MYRLLNVLALCLLVSLVGVAVLRHLSYPLLWNDEAETIVYGDRILDFGYPKAHDGKNLVYELLAPLPVGLKEEHDAYIGSTWGQYYFAAPGAAWARGTADPWEKTLRARLPFALAGLAGLAVLFVAATTGWPSDTDRRLQLASLYCIFMLLSVSLLLHLREARHYPLVVLLVGVALLVHVRRFVLQRMSFAAYLAIQALLVFLLFNVFSLPAFTLVVGLGLDRLRAFLQSPGALRSRAAQLAADVAPFVLAAVLLVPIWWYFETFAIASVLADAPVRFSPATHLSVLLDYLVHCSVLLPAVATKVVAMTASALAARDGISPRGRIAREISHLLWSVVIAYVAVTCTLPFSYERYVLVLLPILVLALLVDSATTLALARATPARVARHALFGALGLAWIPSAAWLLPQRLAEVRAHELELRVPYRGPLDFAVEWIRREYPHPEDLVITTNYEAPALVYYLGSHVTVGAAGAELEQDLAVRPDLIIPRRWTRQNAVLAALAKAAPYEVVRFDVADLPYNNVPQIHPSRLLPVTHQFETPRPAEPDSAFFLLRRVAPDDAPPP